MTPHAHPPRAGFALLLTAPPRTPNSGMASHRCYQCSPPESKSASARIPSPATIAWTCSTKRASPYSYIGRSGGSTTHLGHIRRSSLPPSVAPAPWASMIESDPSKQARMPTLLPSASISLAPLQRATPTRPRFSLCRDGQPSWSPSVERFSLSVVTSKRLIRPWRHVYRRPVRHFLPGGPAALSSELPRRLGIFRLHFEGSLAQWR